MILTRVSRMAAALSAAGLILVGCGQQDSSASTILTLLQQSGRTLTGQQPPIPTVTREQLDAIRTAATQPVAIVGLASNGSQAPIIEIERNGRYRTYATSARQSITLLSGMITSTRGLGGDLMSTDADALLRRLQSGQTGTALYTVRFLTAEDVIEEIRFTCLVTFDEGGAITVGPARASGRSAVADCNNDDLRVTNRFTVGRDGYILGADQWMGDGIQRMTLVALRR